MVFEIWHIWICLIFHSHTLSIIWFLMEFLVVSQNSGNTTFFFSFFSGMVEKSTAILIVHFSSEMKKSISESFEDSFFVFSYVGLKCWKFSHPPWHVSIVMLIYWILWFCNFMFFNSREISWIASLVNFIISYISYHSHVITLILLFTYVFSFIFHLFDFFLPISGRFPQVCIPAFYWISFISVIIF